MKREHDEVLRWFTCQNPARQKMKSSGESLSGGRLTINTSSLFAPVTSYSLSNYNTAEESLYSFFLAFRLRKQRSYLKYQTLTFDK